MLQGKQDQEGFLASPAPLQIIGMLEEVGLEDIPKSAECAIVLILLGPDFTDNME